MAAKKTAVKKSPKKTATKKVVRGERLTKASYKIAPTKGKAREFKGTLIGTMNHGKQRLAIFSVPKKSLN